MNNAQREEIRTRAAVLRFCEKAREFGLVIDPATVALELAADHKQISVAAQLLANHTAIVDRWV